MPRNRSAPAARHRCQASADDPIALRRREAGGDRRGEPASRAPLGHARAVVYLVGAGPGDPELLTLRAARLMQDVDVVVYDHLVSDEVLALVDARAERIYAGKRQGCHALSQTEINKLLVALAREGKRVLRLKGGDPFVFGRGGEECEVLAAHGISFEVVPGVTSASGASCYANIPLTHREHAQAVVLVTGHLKDDAPALDWEMLARPRQTVVIYMGVTRLAEICRQLIAHGASAALPAAVVERATSGRQRVVTGTLSDLPQAAAARDIKPPALIVIGEVVRVRARLESLMRSQAASCEALAC